MKAYTKKSHVQESANDKIFGFVISLILILFAVITAIPLISEANVPKYQPHLN
jgi:putative aldouronate transport system permease protein